MCDLCGDGSSSHSNFSRRNFVKWAGGALVGLSLPGAVMAATPAVPPKPRNVIGPDEALSRLQKGNRRYVKGTAKRHDFVSERPALVLGQNPYAGILSCADSRVAPEYAFDTGRGDVFICRVAGNFANAESVASLEYGVAALGLPLIVVLGHQACGAIASTIKTVKDGESFPGHIPSLIHALKPAVKNSLKKSGDLLENSIFENVRLNVEKLKSSGPILRAAVKEGRLRIVGGVYNLEDGEVDWI